MIENLTLIEKDNLIEEVSKLRESGARLIVMTCVDLGDKFEILYYFAMLPSTDMKVLKVVIAEDEELPSITDVYICALLNENEFQEFYGLKIKNLAVDYKGNLFLAKDSPSTPMRKPKKEGE